MTHKSRRANTSDLRSRDEHTLTAILANVLVIHIVNVAVLSSLAVITAVIVVIIVGVTRVVLVIVIIRVDRLLVIIVVVIVACGCQVVCGCCRLVVVVVAV